MKAGRIFGYVLILCFIGFLGFTFSDHPVENSSPKDVSIVGTYKFMYRKLPNGTELKPPTVMGLQTFTKEYRNFNIMWVDNDGHHFSLSVVSKYKLTDKEYTETLLYSVMNDEAGIIKKGVTYTTNQTKSTPVKMKDGKISFQFPFDPPYTTFEGNKMIASKKGMFTDYWEKVE